MTVTAASFRADFSEFSSATDYPDPDINFWVGVATKLLNAPRWDTMLDVGIELFTAHNLAIGKKGKADAANGNAPGLATGMLSAGSVDKVSFSYDTASVAELDAGHWNLSTYGQRFIHLARMMGAGPIHISAADAAGSSGFWPGPWGYW